MKTILKITVNSESPFNIQVMDTENESVIFEDQVTTNQVSELPEIRFKGTKIDLIRIIYSLCLLDYFVDSNGNRVPDYKVFKAFGLFFRINMSDYCNHLNRIKQENTSMKTQTSILKKMKEAIRKYFEIS